MAERAGYGVKRNYKLLNWEQNEFPIACENCLGESEYLRMLKSPLGAECKLCTRPYTTFNWRDKSSKAKLIKTEICSTCAKINNCCQSCVYDLKYNLPIDIRNKLMGDQKVNLLMSEGNRDLFAHLANENFDQLQLPYDKIEENLDKKIQKFVKKKNIENNIKIKQKDDKIKNEENNQIDKNNIEEKDITNLFYKMEDDQKDIAENIYKTKKIFYNNNYEEKRIRLKYIYPDEEEIFKEKVENIFTTKFELIFDNEISFVKFDNRENAEKFLKIFLDCLTIKGRKIELEWMETEEEVINENETNLPPLPDTYDYDIDEKKKKNIFLENLDKKFIYDFQENKKGGKNLVDY